MAYNKKVDANQKEIVALFRQLGAVVAITSSAGDGFPDLVVQFTPRNRACTGRETHLVEVKDGKKSPSRQALTRDQVKFHSVFECTIVNCKADVYRLMGVHIDD